MKPEGRITGPFLVLFRFSVLECVCLWHRDDEELQLLTANRQSGGERAVCTILYIIALQVTHPADSPAPDSFIADSTHAESPTLE